MPNNNFGAKLGQIVQRSMRQAVNNVANDVLSEMIAGGNPVLGQILRGLRDGGDPIAMLRQYGGNTQQAQNAMNVLQGKSPEELRNVFENMARERGVDAADVERRLGIPAN